MEEPILVKLKMKKRYKSTLAFLGIIILGFLSVGVLYFFYDKVLNVPVEVNGVLSINYVDGKKINTDDSKIIKFSVTNESDKVAYYYVSFSNVIGKGNYSLYYNDSVIMEGNLDDSTAATNYISLDAKETKDYILKVNADSKIKGNINVEIPSGTIFTFADTILKNTPPVNEAKTKVGTEEATEYEGLIKSIDDLGISYYYRGNIVNNYVSFADKTWRIVRVNGDGTTRLVLDDAISDVGSYYTDEDESFEFKNVNMSSFLSDWFQNNLKEKEKYIANTKFCSDIVKDNTNNYIAYKRIMTDKIPTLNCLGELFSSNIGLLTIDEVILAGASPSNSNSSFYLYNSSLNEPWYTMSGAKGNDKDIYMFMIGTNGNVITNVEGNLYRKVRPVINLIKNIEVSGDGTKTNPYIVIE